MVVIGNFRDRAELRKKPRRPFHFSASVVMNDKCPPYPCVIADISEAGARLVLDNDCDLPERFILLLSRNGEARRSCRLVWRDGLTVGVEFPSAAP